MKRDAWTFGLSGAIFGVLVGWIIGTQRVAPGPAPAPSAQAAAPSASDQNTPVVDAARVADLEAQAKARPTDATVRTDLANLYFDARRFDLAIPWYEAALKLEPKNVNVSTDLAVAYFSVNELDRALKQVDYSLAIDRKHVKTLLNQGIFLAMGKKDMEGAAASWQQVVAIAPDSAEARIARQGLDGIKGQHTPEPGAKGRGGTEPRP